MLVEEARIGGGRLRTFDGPHDPTFAFTLYLRPCAWRYRRCITACAGRGGMISSRLSASRLISPYLARTRAAWFGQGERARERVIAALANPLAFGFGSISNSAVPSSLRKNAMSHSLYQPDPACVHILQTFPLSPFPFLSPRTNFELTERVPVWPTSVGTITESTVRRPRIR